MKKAIIIVTLVIGSLLGTIPSISAQKIHYGYQSPAIENINKSDIYVVMSGDKEFDDALVVSVKNYWKQSGYKIISKDELESHLGNENNYFIAPVVFGNVSVSIGGAHEISGTHFHYIAIFNGKENKLKKYSLQTIIGYVPFINRDTKWFSTTTDYMVKGLNDGVEFVKKNAITGSTAKIIDAVLAENTKNVSILKEKTLVVTKGFYASEKMEKYKYKYKVLPSEEIAQLCKTGSKEYCVMAYGGDPNKQFFIYDLDTKKIIYGFATTKANDIAISARDFLNLNDAIEGIIK